MVSLVIGKPAMALGEQGLDLTRFYAQEITEAKLVGDNEFRLVFQDGATLTIHDAGSKDGVTCLSFSRVPEVKLRFWP